MLDAVVAELEEEIEGVSIGYRNDPAVARWFYPTLELHWTQLLVNTSTDICLLGDETGLHRLPPPRLRR